LGRASPMVQELMRRVRDENLADAVGSPIGYIPFDSVVSQSVVIEMDEILNGLAGGEVKTNVMFEKP
jgi:hypothetical protein